LLIEKKKLEKSFACVSKLKEEKECKPKKQKTRSNWKCGRTFWNEWYKKK